MERIEDRDDAALIALAGAAGITGDVAALRAELARRSLLLHGHLLVRGALPEAMVAVVGARACEPGME